jgi:uncharacterized protein
MVRIGFISDTHGLWRPEAERFLRGCDHIVHAGDIGRPDILQRLSQLAPVTAIRGNNDTGDWAAALPDTQAVTLAGVAIFVLHDAKELARHPAPPVTQVIVCGHSHQPSVMRQPSGVLLVNPGSAGPRRFKLPVSAAELLVSSPGEFSARLATLI